MMFLKAPSCVPSEGEDKFMISFAIGEEVSPEREVFKLARMASMPAAASSS